MQNNVSYRISLIKCVYCLLNYDIDKGTCTFLTTIDNGFIRLNIWNHRELSLNTTWRPRHLV